MVRATLRTLHQIYPPQIYSTFRWGGDRRPIENHYLASIPKIEVSFIDMKSAVYQFISILCNAVSSFSRSSNFAIMRIADFLLYS
jgi:hypothetical protein